MIYQELSTNNILDYEEIKKNLTSFTKEDYNFILNIKFDYNYIEKNQI
jgi:hypothetical protein